MALETGSESLQVAYLLHIADIAKRRRILPCALGVAPEAVKLWANVCLIDSAKLDELVGMSEHDQLQRPSQHLRFEFAQCTKPETATERGVEFSYSATENCSYGLCRGEHLAFGPALLMTWPLYFRVDAG